MKRSLALCVGLLLLASPTASAEKKQKLKIIPSVLANFPHPLNGAIDVRLPSSFSFGISGGMLSVNIPNAFENTPVDISSKNYEVRFRWHPFNGSLFLGVAGGRQTLSASATDNVMVGATAVPTTVNVAVNSLYVAPHAGWMWVYNSGITLGFELGWLFPVGPSSDFAVTINDPAMQSLLTQVQGTAQYADMTQNINDANAKSGAQSVPFITLLRIGYAF